MKLLSRNCLLLVFLLAIYTGAAVGSVALGATPDAFSVAEADRPRSVFWSPFASLLLPGFDQWWEGQYAYATAYSGVGLASIRYAAFHAQAFLDSEAGRVKPERLNNATERNGHIRRSQLGAQLYQSAGGMSAYHAFRSAARTRMKVGEYTFLGRAETPTELMLAPFAFEHLSKPSTWIPLLAASIFPLWVFSRSDDELARDGIRRARLTRDDAFFAAARSYNAGVWEEAAFRGWLLPVMREGLGSDRLAVYTNAAVFALAHIGTNPVPLPQAILGWHLADITVRNDWELSEAIFIHFWWDVIILGSAAALRDKDPALVESLPPLVFPALNVSF